MRTLGFRTQVVVALVAAVGVLVALGRPWYAPSPQAVEDGVVVGEFQGSVDRLANGFSRWVGELSGTNGWDALGGWSAAVAALAALTASGALGCLLPSVQGVAREALRYGSLGCFGVVVWKLIDTPGPNELLEPRYGALAAAGAALVAVLAGTAAASAPLQRRRS